MVGQEVPGSGFNRESLKKKFRFSEFISEKIISSIAFLTIAIILLIFVFVFKETLPIFHQGKAKQAKTEQVSDKPETYGAEPSDQPEVYGAAADSANPVKGDEFDSAMQARYGENVSEKVIGIGNLLGTEWQPVSDRPRYGLIPLLVGTLKITFIALLIAAPIAIMAALFSAAFAPTWLRELIKPAVEILAGFPSVVIGFFALMVMATFFQDLFGYGARLNAFVGGVAMALAAIPIIFTVTEDVMTAVPGSYKEASLALGASRWQTAFFVTLPAATPGIFAALLLGIGRIFGETMIALMATGNAVLISANPFESVRTFAATIGAEMAEVVFGDTHYSVLFLIGALLFIFTFSLNAIAEFYVKSRLMKRFQGKTS
jgi:phosphate transport system permease protein